MVDVIGRGKVIITGDVDTTSVGAAGGKIGDTLKKGAVIGGAALASLAAGGVRVYQAFETAEAQSRKLNRVLENVGEGKATPAVEELADQLMRLTGIDDEVIKGGELILATFDSINDSAGETGGVFDRATRAAVDMSSVFGSVESASKTLGKALEDPTKATALLRRTGVTLNEEQSKLIENFVKAGEKAKAQDVILDALEDRYKGTAEAASTESGKIQTAFGELEESAGHLIDELVGGDKKKGGGLSGAIYSVSDALNETAESDAWGQLGKDTRDAAGEVKGLTGQLYALDKRIGTTVLKLPGFGKALLDLVDPTHGMTGLILDLVDAIQKLNDASEKFPTIDKGKKTNLGNSDFIDQITGSSAVGGRIGAGLRLVGENGPEVISIGSGGGYVHNNSETRAMLSGSPGGDVINYWQFYGPESLSQARRDEDWARTYGTRFGAAASAGAR